MTVNSIQLVNFGLDLNSADIIICNDKQESYMGRIQKIDQLMEQLKNGREINSALNYLYLPNSIVVDEINEESMFEMVHNLLDDGDFFNVFRKI